MNLTGFREAVADVLDQLPEVQAGEWAVHSTWVDALQPPAFVVQHGDGANGWFTPESVCADMATVSVLCVAARLTPEGENLPTLEAMVDTAVTELATARLRPSYGRPPGPAEIGKVAYLAARLLITRPVQFGGTP